VSIPSSKRKQQSRAKLQKLESEIEVDLKHLHTLPLEKRKGMIAHYFKEIADADDSNAGLLRNV